MDRQTQSLASVLSAFLFNGSFIVYLISN
jgi:hypothetical protein